MIQEKIQKGVYDVEIVGIGTKGDKMCKLGESGFIVVVPNTNKEIGQTIRINLYKVLEHVGFGEEL